jgi:arginase family enzyme
LGNDSVTGETLVPISLDGKHHPRIITLGGDHTIVLPILRSINSVYGKISVIHFDSHLGLYFSDPGILINEQFRYLEALGLRGCAE